MGQDNTHPTIAMTACAKRCCGRPWVARGDRRRRCLLAGWRLGARRLRDVAAVLGDARLRCARRRPRPSARAADASRRREPTLTSGAAHRLASDVPARQKRRLPASGIVTDSRGPDTRRLARLPRARIATAGTPRCRFEPTGRPKGCRGCGSSRSGSATRRSSSPDGRAFTIEQRRDQEVVAAYDIETGREIWTNGWDGAFTESMGGDGPRATPDLSRRAASTRSARSASCGASTRGPARVVWRRNILDGQRRRRTSQWGMSAAPLIVDDKVDRACPAAGGQLGRRVRPGDRRRRSGTSLDDAQAYTSPMLVTLAGTRQILVVSASRGRRAAFPRTAGCSGSIRGSPTWASTCAQPLLLGDDRVFLSAGYGTGAAVFEVTRAGETVPATTDLGEHAHEEQVHELGAARAATSTGWTRRFSRASTPRPAS